MPDIKPRILPLPRKEWTDAAREVFAFWGEPDAWENGSKTNIMMVLANHPALAMAYNNFGKHLLINSTLSQRAKELIILRISWLVRSDYEWHYHVGYALNIGMTLEEIAAIKEGPTAPNWDEHDRSILSICDELKKKNRVSNKTWKALSRHFDKHQLIDLVFTIGSYVMTAWAIAALGVQLEDGRDKIGYDLKTASGATPGATFKPGENDSWASKSG